MAFKFECIEHEHPYTLFKKPKPEILPVLWLYVEATLHRLHIQA